jgi:hypothetical protein
MTAPRPILPSAAEAIRALMPWASDEEVKSRAKLLRMQQSSTTRALNSSSDVARGFWWEINAQAAANVMKPAGCEELDELTKALVYLAMAADTLERRAGR